MNQRRHIHGIYEVHDRSGKWAKIEAEGIWQDEEETNADWWSRVKYRFTETELDFNRLDIDRETVTEKLEQEL